MSVIVKLLSKFDDSGIKKAQHGFGGLKKVIGGIAVGAALKQIGDVLLDAAKAASADAKSVKLMNMQLTKNAGATKESLKQNDKFIESLSLQTGILDDDLRPSLSKFGNVTKNVKQAQKLLTLSLDVTAGSGKSQTKVANALAKAYAGNTKSLIGMFPELKNSKNALADLTKEFSGAALVNADPFMKFNNSMDILKEKLGNLVLPMIADLVTELTKPGGVVETVGKFLTDMANPKTEPGKMFLQIKDAVKQTFQGVKDFFALFGNGDAMKGFANIASQLVKMLPALLVLKGIMMLASAGKAIQSLVTAMGLIQGKNAIPTGGGGVGGVPAVVGGAGATAAAAKSTSLFSGMAGLKVLSFMKLAPMIGVGMGGDITNDINSSTGKTNKQTMIDQLRAKAKREGKTFNESLFNDNQSVMSQLFAGKTQPKSTSNNITINVQGADPKAVVDAVSRYVKQNGVLPSAWAIGMSR
jgi:hypothetical protein